MKNSSFILVLILILFAFAPPADDYLEKIRQQWQAYEESLPHEQVYLSISEDVVASGDTAWFGGYLKHSQKESKVLYVELTNERSSLMKESFNIRSGFVSGQLSIPDSLSSGLYYLRAYTQWMRNGEEYTFFRQPLLVINSYDENPPMPNRLQYLDTRLQVQPEGGQWVAGVPGQLRVSLGGEENKSLSGQILRLEDSASIADIRLENGLDLIPMQPDTGSAYLAEVYLPSGDTLTARLPEAKLQGVSLMAELQNDRLKIRAYNTKLGAQLYLLVRSKDALLHSALMQEPTAVLDISLNPKLSGLVEISVVNRQAQVLAQRLLYHEVAPHSLEVDVAKKQYAPREDVTVSLALPEGLSAARVSLSVRKVNPLSLQVTQNIGETWSGGTEVLSNKDLGQDQINQWLIGRESPFVPWKRILTAAPQSLEFVKEDEYFLLSGKLTNPAGEALKNEMALLSVPGFNPHFDYDRTDSAGRFYLPVYDVYGEKEVIFHLYSDTLEADWVLDDKFAPLSQSPKSVGQQPLVKQQTWNEILKHYQQRAQVRRQYGLYQANANRDIKRKSRFYGEPNFEIRLDDYIALPDFIEVCRELMPGIRLRKEGDQYVFSVFDVRSRTFLENPPALLLDGVLIKNPDDIVSLSPADIDRIETVNRRTYYGEYRFDGMIAVYTKQGNAYLDALPPSAKQREVTFFTPVYPFKLNDKSAPHLPDFRTLLMWKPAIDLNGTDTVDISFPNGDETGTFEVVAEGISKNGQTLYGRAQYTVGVSHTP